MEEQKEKKNINMFRKLKIKLRPYKKYSRKIILFIIILFFIFCYLFLSKNNHSETDKTWTSVVRCKSQVAKLTIPDSTKRHQYLSPLGTNYKEIEEEFFHIISTITTNCGNQEHLGPPEDGGWDFCLEKRYDIRSPCLVYSFGVGTKDFKFEKDVERFLKCEVHAFDPSMNLSPFKVSNQIFFHDFGIDNVETIDMKTKWRMKKLKNIMKELGHENRDIDYLKMDIEFSEWMVLNDLLKSNFLSKIRQISMEIHTPEVDIHERGDHPCASTNQESLAFMLRTLIDLKNFGFSLFSSRTNHRTSFTSRISNKQRFCCHNVHFVNRNHPKNAFVR